MSPQPDLVSGWCLVIWLMRPAQDRFDASLKLVELEGFSHEVGRAEPQAQYAVNLTLFGCEQLPGSARCRDPCRASLEQIAGLRTAAQGARRSWRGTLSARDRAPEGTGRGGSRAARSECSRSCKSRSFSCSASTMRTAPMFPEAKASFESSFIRRSVCRRSKSTASITTSRHTCRSAISLALNILATLVARRRDLSPSRPARRQRLSDAAAGFAVHTTRRMSEPVLAASGFTVSELPHNVRHAMHPCGFR
jgi:hypothetical protein